MHLTKINHEKSWREILWSKNTIIAGDIHNTTTQLVVVQKSLLENEISDNILWEELDVEIICLFLSVNKALLLFIYIRWTSSKSCNGDFELIYNFKTLIKSWYSLVIIKSLTQHETKFSKEVKYSFNLKETKPLKIRDLFSEI